MQQQPQDLEPVVFGAVDRGEERWKTPGVVVFRVRPEIEQRPDQGQGTVVDRQVEAPGAALVGDVGKVRRRAEGAPHAVQIAVGDRVVDLERIGHAGWRIEWRAGPRGPARHRGD